MKKAYSLFEITLVIFVISILATYAIVKMNNTLDFVDNVKIKSEIALIRSAITEKLSANTLLNEENNFKLDSASLNTKNSKLFGNILKKPLLSTTNSLKEIGKWIKEQQGVYKIYISKDKYLLYAYENKSFICKSTLELCESYE